MNREEAYKKLAGHGRIVCKLCQTVLASCRCMSPHEPIMVTCDKCLNKIADHELTLSQGEDI